LGQTCLVGGGCLLLAVKVKRAWGQQPAKMSRIGYLGFGPASAWATRVEALRAGLRDLAPSMVETRLRGWPERIRTRISVREPCI
jgi:hypothetical protein